MDSSVNTSSRPAVSGGARAFVAARLRRRQELEAAPELHWDCVMTPSAGSAHLPDGTPVWVLSVTNAGGEARDTRVVLFTAESVVRAMVGADGRIGGDERWRITLDDTDAQPSQALRGYALTQSQDGRWHACTIDGRSASFRTKPDELGVLRTLGLRMPLNPTFIDGAARSERAA